MLLSNHIVLKPQFLRNDLFGGKMTLYKSKSNCNTFRVSRISTPLLFHRLIHEDKRSRSNHEEILLENSFKEMRPCATVVHVINGVDFPHTLYSSIFDLSRKYRVKELIFAINKMDKVERDIDSARLYYAPYYKLAIQKICKEIPGKLFVTSSGIKKWGAKELNLSLPKDHESIYFIGEEGVGKSTLIKDTIRSNRKFSETKQPTEIDGPYALGIDTFKFTDDEKNNFYNNLPKAQCPIPSITREDMGKKIIRFRNIATRLSPKGPRSFFEKDECISVGGLIYIINKVSASSLQKTTPPIRGKDIFISANLEAAKEKVKKNPEFVFTKPGVEDSLVKYEVPLKGFEGENWQSVEIVIKHLGVINITTPPNKEIALEVWAPPSFILSYRDPIYYVTHKVVKKGNPAITAQNIKQLMTQNKLALEKMNTNFYARLFSSD